MANKNLFLKSGFIRAPLQNGVGRYIGQLQRITLKFCKSHGSSRGMRDFIENNLVDFAKENPGVAVYVKPRRHRGPVIVAEYLNGDRNWKSARKETAEEISKWVNMMRLQHGNTSAIRYRKHWQTNMPSIQGPWTAFTHKNPLHNLVVFPDEEVGGTLNKEQSATDKLLELVKAQSIQASEAAAQSDATTTKDE